MRACSRERECNVYVCTSACVCVFFSNSERLYTVLVTDVYTYIYIYIYIYIYKIMWVPHISPSPPQKSRKSAQKSAISPKKRPTYPQKCPILQTFPRNLNLPLIHTILMCARAIARMEASVMLGSFADMQVSFPEI